MIFLSLNLPKDWLSFASGLSQRAISKRLNCSLGKTNETIKNLKELEYINDDNSLTDLGIDLIKKNKSAVILAASKEEQEDEEYEMCRAFVIQAQKA